ncbi:hypothetical protein BS17DRAFT_788164 [Gyrodon lividus]|nr:hypothetical protein BS17DRAFT_788164 [Gyrodon lividus]
MFNNPKRATYVLSFLYLLVTIQVFVVTFLWKGPHSGFVNLNATLVDVTVCIVELDRSPMLSIYAFILGPLFDFLLLALVLYRFAVHSMEAQRMLGGSRVNVYMRVLFEHNIVYFFFNFLLRGFQAGILALSLAPVSMPYSALAIPYCATVPYVLYPRLILSFRGHRSQSDGFYVGTDGPLYPQPHSTLSGDPSREAYELSDLNP